MNILKQFIIIIMIVVYLLLMDDPWTWTQLGTCAKQIIASVEKQIDWYSWCNLSL